MVVARPQSEDRLRDRGLVDGRYSLIEKTGVGAMGIVYRGEDVWLRRSVAIKIIDPVHSTDPGMRQRFAMEARALAEVHHDNVVQVYAFGRHPPSSLYLAMEFVSGPNLEMILEERVARGEAVDLDAAVAILRYVGRGLDAVHARGIIHRDVKPSNVIIEATTGRPVLIDFGVAQHVGTEATPASIGGTPAYMAPEQIAGDVEITHRADIYALGCTAFEMLTGNVPFSSEQPWAVLLAHSQAPRPLVSSVKPDLWAFDEPIVRAMATDPRERYASCDEFIADFERSYRRRSSGLSLVPAMPDSPMVRVLVLTRDEPLRRHLRRHADRAIDGLNARAEIEAVPSVAGLMSALLQVEADLVIVDEDSFAESDVVQQLIVDIRGARAEAVVLQRDYPSHPRRLAVLGAHPIPKPINGRLVEAVLARLAEKAIRARRDASASFAPAHVLARDSCPPMSHRARVET